MSDLEIQFVEWICSQMNGYAEFNQERQNQLFDLINDAWFTNGQVTIQAVDGTKTFDEITAQEWLATQ